MITLKQLDEEERESLRAMAESIYLDGECYAFAIALHRGLGWQMRALRTDTIRHVLLRDARDGSFWDVRGRVKLKDIGTPFGIQEFGLLDPVGESDLFAIRRVDDLSISRAAWMAQALWPHLPWKDGVMQKYAAFLRELELLSQKHGVYLYASLPTAWPVLTEAAGGEVGYAFKPSVTGPSYFINRQLENE